MSMKETLRTYRSYALLVALALALAASPPLWASIILTAGTVTAASPSSDNSFDLTLTNSGPAAVTVGGFSLGISVSDSHVSFTSATTATSTAPYIFDGFSLFGPVISTSSGQALTASDSFAVIGSGSTLGAGVTVGLAHVFFDLTGAATGPLTIMVAAFPTTSLSDASGNNIPISTSLNGTITISGATVPEPATFALLAIGIAGIGFTRLRKQ